MGSQIQPTVDVIGDMSQSELNTQDIQNIMSKVNDMDKQNGVSRTVTGFDDYYDKAGQARIRIGQAPDDQRMGIWMTKPGQDVITNLGG